MSTEQSLQIDSTSIERTLEIGVAIGTKLRGGEVIELTSDLGGGKTALVRGIAKGMGSHDAVRSPSFTISNQYQSGDITLYHFDFYRLNDAGIVRDELAELLNDSKAVVVIEWSDVVQNILPDNRVQIQIMATGENSRTMVVTYGRDYVYLFSGVDLL